MLYYYNGESHSLILVSEQFVSFSTQLVFATVCLRHFIHKASRVCSFCPQRGRQWCAPVHFFTVLQLHLAKRCSFSMLDSEERKNEAVMENCRNEKGTGHVKRISHDKKSPPCCASLKRNILAQISEHKHTFILTETDNDSYLTPYYLLFIYLIIVHFPLSFKKKKRSPFSTMLIMKIFCR